MPKLIANALLFQLGWLVCVFAGDSPWLLVVAVIIGVHLLWVSSWAAEGKLLLSVFLAGSALDSFLLNLGVFDFGEERQLIPLWLALLCAGLSLLLAVLALEAQQGRRPPDRQWPLWLICLPLLLPQASLLFGLRLQIDWLGAVDGIGPGWVLWSQLLFVFPYVYLCLHGPYRQFDDRLTRAALSLGASPWRAWWQVKGPLLARPLLFAFGVGAAVSLAQYLPTLLFGAGRVVTITTEAVAIGSGLNRRLAGLYGLLQLLLPLFIYGLVLWLPRRINPALRP